MPKRVDVTLQLEPPDGAKWMKASIRADRIMLLFNGWANEPKSHVDRGHRELRVRHVRP